MCWAEVGAWDTFLGPGVDQSYRLVLRHELLARITEHFSLFVVGMGASVNMYS